MIAGQGSREQAEARRLAYADPAAELPACVVALDASLVLVSREGERRVAARAFFTGLLETALRPGELIAAVEVPCATAATRSTIEEVARRRRLNEEGRGALEQALRDGGYEVAGPAVANFVYADVGGDAQPLFEALLRLGVIVRPLAAFGAPGAIRVSVGTPEETAIFAEALAHVRAATA